ncbi:MAG: toprim domain-containing protein, partial [Bacteroidales bacterium]
ESQTKTKLGSMYMVPNGKSIRSYIGEVLKKNLDNELHRRPDIAKAIQEKILFNEKQRKDINNIKKVSREVLKKASLHNKKLRDCKIHFNTNHERRLETSIFITEGDSASGSITKARDANIQAVFSLKGKPLNVHKASKKSIFTNEEFALLIAALNIDNGLDNLRYNNVIIATDADEDGKHIRLLLLTFFLKFYPDLIKAGHLYVLQTPLFRVRNKQKTIYCYSDTEKQKALNQLGSSSEITRFKGLGEISPDEFRQLIGKNIRLEPIVYNSEIKIDKLLDFYMGENTATRAEFVIENLRYNEILDLL